MQSPNPPRPPFPPRPGADPEESDRNLVARLGTTEAGARPVALLLTRHWQATHDYAAICLATHADSASMAATAAFHRVLGRASGGALRPQLLMAARDTVKEWAANDDISALLPELRKPTGGRGLLAARAVTAERRRLAERAFRALPGASQCLLWHTEVEAEPISVPAVLLGVDAGTATAALEQAQEQFRAGCVRAHRELAPSRECRFYNRLLDVPIRRGGALLPDVQRHLMVCRYCRYAAEQLSHFEGGLEALLAETVLGWGARRYLDSRPGRAAPGNGPATPGIGRQRAGGRHRPAPDGHLPAPPRHTKAVLVGAGLISLVLLATVLVAKGWSDDAGVPDPGATWGAASGNSVRPSTTSPSPGSPSAASAANPLEVGQGRLRNLGSGLCLGLGGGRTEAGAGAVLAKCSSAGSQQWSYQEDGLLRSVLDPTLCLDSDPHGRSVVVADCLAHAGEVRYDFTVRGELLLRGGKGRLVASGKGTRPAVTARDGSAGQRWRLESESADTGTRGESTRPEDDPQGGRPEERQDPKGIAPSAGAGIPDAGSADPTEQYESPFAQVGSEPRRPADGAGTLTADARDTVTAVTHAVTEAADAAAATLGSVLP